MNSESINAMFQLQHGEFQLNVDLSFPANGVTILFGHSGSGKTTLLRCIAGLERPKLGYLSVKGQIWQDSHKRFSLPTHQRSLGYVFQEANLFPHLNIIDNLHFGLKRSKNSSGNLDSIIELLGIAHLLKRLPEHLSGGERQRVAIARAIVLNPDILLMDEPLSSLDNQRKQEVMPYLLKIHEEFAIPIVYVTHSQHEAAQLGDYLILLENGQVKASGELTKTLSRLDTPLSQEKHAAVVWTVEIVSHEPEYQLTNVQFKDGTLSLPIIHAPIGKQLRIQIFARDVSITLQTQNKTSILNVIPGIISGIMDSHADYVIVQVRCGEALLLSHITRKSLHLLNLKMGMSVYVQIKGTSLLQ